VPEVADGAKDAQSTDDRQNRFSLSLGNLVHQALAHIAQCHKKGISYRQAAMHEYLEQRLPELDAYPDQWQSVKETTIRHIDTTLADSMGQWILAPNAYGQIEWPITTVSDRLPKRLIMDRVFFSEDCWWIIDFKTAEPDSGEALEDFFEQEVRRYRDQLEQYLSALSALLSDQPNRFGSTAVATAPIKTALYFTALAHLETLP
jgi:ATP-dependent exoDNAse (exonuclease V) beta subunit